MRSHPPARCAALRLESAIRPRTAPERALPAQLTRRVRPVLRAAVIAIPARWISATERTTPVSIRRATRERCVDLRLAFAIRPRLVAEQALRVRPTPRAPRSADRLPECAT